VSWGVSAMIKTIIALMLSMGTLGCMADGVTFSKASRIALTIIEVQAESPICHPVAVPAVTREALALALMDIASPGYSDSSGLTPMDYAVISDYVPAIEHLMSVGYPLTTKDGTLLHGAALYNSKQAISFLLANGVSARKTNEYRASPLMVAASEGRLEIAQDLIKAGSPVNARNRDGGTALHYAIGCRNILMIDALLSAGAIVDSKANSLAVKYNVPLVQHER